MPFFLPFLITIFGLIRSGVSAFKDPDFRALSFLLLTLLGLGTIFYHEVEHWRFIDALYFSVMTLTTVGYGDLVPKTDAAKIFSMLYILIGLGIMFGFIDFLARHTRQNQKNDSAHISLRTVSRIIRRKKQTDMEEA